MNGVIQPTSIFNLSNNFVGHSGIGFSDLSRDKQANKKRVPYWYTSLYNLHNFFICFICFIFTVTS